MADKWDQYADQYAAPGADKWDKYAQPAPPPPKPLGEQSATPMGVIRSLPSAGLDVAKGVIKGLGRTAYDAASGVLPMPEPVTNKIHALTEPSNTVQRMGSFAPDIAMLAAPGGLISHGIEALPSTARAGANFTRAMQVAKDVPVDVSKYAQPVLRARQLNQVAGDPMAPVLRKAFQTIMPTTQPTTYENARILASSAGRKAQQTAMGGKLTGEMGRRLSETARGLDEATAEAAQKAGVGDIHNSAMKEYRNAMRLKEGAKTAAKIAVPAAIGSGLAYKGLRGFGYLGD